MLLTLPIAPLTWPTTRATWGYIPTPPPAVSHPRRPRAGDPPSVGNAGGVATRLGVWAFSGLGPPGTMSLIQTGAFDESLAAIEAGRAGVLLTLDHAYDQSLSSTFDGSLTLALLGNLLLFRVTPDSPEGRAAVAAIRARPTHRQASVSYKVEASRQSGSCGRTRVVVERATLLDVAIVRRGACEQCAVWAL